MELGPQGRVCSASESQGGVLPGRAQALYLCKFLFTEGSMGRGWWEGGRPEGLGQEGPSLSR